MGLIWARRVTQVGCLFLFLFFLLKTGFFLFLYMWIRWTLPRFRYDQLMSLGWKFMLPLALCYLVVMAGAILVLDALRISPTAHVLGFIPTYGAILGVLNLVLAVLVFVILDRGRILSPAYARLGAVELARLRAASARSPLAPVQGD